MSKHVNEGYIEKNSDGKVCSNCNLTTDGSWVMECFCGCNATTRCCLPCLNGHFSEEKK